MKELFRTETDPNSWAIDDILEERAVESSTPDASQILNPLREAKLNAAQETVITHSEHAIQTAASNGNLVTNEPAMIAAEPIKAENPLPSRLLTVYEVRRFKELIKEWDDLMPRQFRIFYYRYLFLKHLLIKYYNESSSSNPWSTTSGIDALITLVRKYSAEGGEKRLADDRKKVFSADEDSIVTLDANPGDTFPKKDLEVLLSVIDLVIAY